MTTSIPLRMNHMNFYSQKGAGAPAPCYYNMLLKKMQVFFLGIQQAQASGTAFTWAGMPIFFW